MPSLNNIGIKTFFCGPESFTPDLSPILGEAPEIRRYFVAAGLNSIGILSGGGVGRALAHWIVNGRPDVDVRGARGRGGVLLLSSAVVSCVNIVLGGVFTFVSYGYGCFLPLSLVGVVTANLIFEWMRS